MPAPNVNSPNLDNQTALMLAVSTGSLPISKLLVERGADVNADGDLPRPERADVGRRRQPAGHRRPAAGARREERQPARQVRRLGAPETSEPRAQFQSRQTGGLTALLYATRSGCLRCAVSLVKAGADVNKPNPDGVTPLINALDNKRFDIAMFLLDKGANPHVWDMSGRTPIYVAVDMKLPVRGVGGGFGGGAAALRRAIRRHGSPKADGGAGRSRPPAPRSRQWM